MGSLLLYHGSRGGIDGDIVPQSRNRCDFGCGFYMGTNPDQAKSLVANDSSPYFYTLKLNIDNINQDRILKVSGMEWAYLVLYNRGRLENIKGSKIYEQCQHMMSNKDIITGPIADDAMNDTMQKFLKGQITDKAFLESIRAIDYGIQYVAKTEFACSQIQIVSEQELSGSDLEFSINMASQRRQEGNRIADKIQNQYRREGKYFDEILEEAQKSIGQSHLLEDFER